MKKIIFALVLVFAGMAGFGLDTFHSDDDICEVYREREATVDYIKRCTLEDAYIAINEHVSYASKDSLVGYVEKPYKNEVVSAYNLVARYYEPEKGELYLVETDLEFFERYVFVWIKEDGNYYYWVYERY